VSVSNATLLFLQMLQLRIKVSMTTINRNALLLQLTLLFWCNLLPRVFFYRPFSISLLLLVPLDIIPAVTTDVSVTLTTQQDSVS